MANWLWTSDFVVEDNIVLVKKTGHRLVLDLHLWHDIFTWFCFFSMANWWRLTRLLGHKPPTIAFTPDKPRPWYLIWPVMHCAGAKPIEGDLGGDMVLVEVARRLQAGARRWDIVARVGGEEFCVIAPAVHVEDEVADLGERLRHTVTERPVLVNGVEVNVTVSIGAALVHPGQGTAEGAVDRADRALYAAKNAGRNRLRRFSQLEDGALTSANGD